MKPPRRVTLLLLAVLIIASLSSLRAVLALAEWSFLSELPGVSPLYQFLTGLIGALTGWLLAWGLEQRRGWAPGLARRAALAWAALEVLERLLLVQRPQPDWIFQLVFLATCLVFVWWSLRGPTISFFGEVYERTS